MQEGKVVINGQVSKNISASVKEGMLIEIANIGRVHIDEIVTTSKGKYKISFRRVKFAAPRQDSSASHKSS